MRKSLPHHSPAELPALVSTLFFTPYPAPRWASPGWGDADGKAPPPPSEGHDSDSLRRARVGQPDSAGKPLSDARPSPSLRKSYLRRYTHPDARTYTLTEGEYQVGPFESPPDHPLGQTSASGEVKTSSRVKGEEQRGVGG